MTRPAFVRQPGEPLAPRIVAVAGRGRAFTLRLEPGRLLVQAVAEGFAREGFASGVLNFGALALSPLAYVMPALSKDGRNAAFYSDTFRPAGITRTQAGALTFGQRDGAPFFHCHALWQEADGRLSGGHILPEETMLAEAVEVSAFGIEGALFEGNPDSETNFKLFGPVPAPSSGVQVDTRSDSRADTRAFALRLRPNQCFHAALEGFVAAQGWRGARLHGGVGSIIGAAFEDGSVVENFATEVFIRQGAIAPDAGGALRATLGVGLIDYTGQRAEGLLRRGANPVLMTFELIVCET